ncbi:putative protein phosphatase 2C 28 isoform X1 [Cucumis melo var. makuwa]|uniref:protein-serine/threonine phosphatase n=1 Tax=Cucumis melo var. makuwa TaxID=1194695 RepID=A0A5A7U9A7_CUCMM|nr:putative protein phosphatase 2C 28 isoform X1 [Cucumis melo var. makuwa]
MKLPKEAKEEVHSMNNEDDERDWDLEDEGGLAQIRRREFTYGSHLVQGKMNHEMEDYIVTEDRHVDDHKLGLFAIFDGHSGRDVAEYLQSHLFDNILSQSDFWEDPDGAIRRAYKETDEEILAKKVGTRGGSTAVTAILIDGQTLIVAHVGDSRAVICRNGSAKPITVDHEPEKEKELVESRGGFVVQMPGSVPRVDGQLAMSRAFGDAKLKEHITSEPDIRIVAIENETEFAILASDGLWKVISNQEACDCIRKMAMDPQKASEKLIKEALSKMSYDDISCIVVTFH